MTATGAPANTILKDRTDAANLELPEYEELTLDQLSFGLFASLSQGTVCWFANRTTWLVTTLSTALLTAIKNDPKHVVGALNSAV